MRKLIDKIKNGELWRYNGGIHPSTHKATIDASSPGLATHAPELIIHLQQHIGDPAKLLVNVGDTVLGGQPLSASELYSAPPVHAPTSGRVVAIEPRPTAHPSGLLENAVIIEPDGKDQWVNPTPLNIHDTPRHMLVAAIHQAGICGMGGAGFPTAIKVAPNQPIELLIINGAECEPYISADNSLMQHYAEQVMVGIGLLIHLTKPKLTIIAIEDDKPAAIAAMTAAAGKQALVRAIPTKYPSGGEKQLVQVLTGKQVPAGGIPAHIGILVQNVGTAYAINQAIHHGRPLTRRLVTLAGDRFAKPRNVWVDIGTPVSHLFDESSRVLEGDTLIMGGPMMGFTLHDANAPITKTSNCVLYGTEDEFALKNNEQPCIRCGQCAEACPVNLLPQQLHWNLKGGQLNKAAAYRLNDCIECGACAYVCPSDIPLVQYYRQGKAELREEHQLAIAAERSRQRFENRQSRLEREKKQREARHQQATERRAAELKGEASSAVQEALSRLNIKRDATPTAPGNADAIAARIARKAQARTNKSDTATAQASPNPAVAAAIARAKAKKAQQQAEATSDTSVGAAKSATKAETADPRKAAVAAAVARAKAKKAQQQAAASADVSVDITANTAETVDPRKAAVAAAVARSKAKKLAQQSIYPDSSTPAENPGTEKES
jgi:electron transport complex protein RnfC